MKTAVCLCSLDTLLIGNNSPKQLLMKIGCAPLASSLKSVQIHLKPLVLCLSANDFMSSICTDYKGLPSDANLISLS